MNQSKAPPFQKNLHGAIKMTKRVVVKIIEKSNGLKKWKTCGS